jgi:hypothetical protein
MTRQRFDCCLSLRIDAIHYEMAIVKAWPLSVRKIKRIVALRRLLRRFERRIPA